MLEATEPILRCLNVGKKFGAFEALKDVSFEVLDGEIYAIAGPNGAGKSTLFNVITNVPYSLTSGKVMFKGKPLNKLPPHEISLSTALFSL